MGELATTPVAISTLLKHNCRVRPDVNVSFSTGRPGTLKGNALHTFKRVLLFKVCLHCRLLEHDVIAHCQTGAANMASSESHHALQGASVMCFRKSRLVLTLQLAHQLQTQAG
jgi:hypothetical protein